MNWDWTRHRAQSGVCCLGLMVIFAWVTSASAAITLDASSGGRTFDGVGAISGGGGNTRLLFDYADPYRAQILDYLFKPNYGASLQILKVEIGSDCDSTDGAEASHMHTPEEENYNRGYEWWLMEEAKKRQPSISLSALPWGAPGWMGHGRDYYTQDLIDYIIKWLNHASSDLHLTIDTISGRNEKGYDIAWDKKFKAALNAQGYSSLRVIGSDDWYHGRSWNIASDMKKDPAFNDAIDIVGGHTPHEDGYPTQDALSLNKPLWASEDHFDHYPAEKEVARSLNRNYINAKITATIYWPIVSAIYDNLPFDNVGLIKCNQPWSGNYRATPSLWVVAHTTQFTQPGWQYLDSACGYFDGDASGNHGSYVALASPKKDDYSLIIETVDATASRTADFSLAGLPSKPLHVWATNLNSKNSADWFVPQADINLQDGNFSLTLQPGCIYSVTTTEGQKKGDATAPPPSALTLPFAEDFNGLPGHPGRYFSDMYGSFEIAPCSGGRTGNCFRQTTPQAPIAWKDTVHRPFTIVGDLKWTDYRVSCDVLLEKPGAVDLLARLSGMSGKDTPNAYVLRVTDAGAWSLIKSTVKDQESVLTAGTVEPLGTNTWHHLGIVCEGANLTIEIDGKAVGAVSDGSYKAGMVGLGTKDYLLAQFGKFRVEPLPDSQASH